MAVSAFKSASRRGTSVTPPQPAPASASSTSRAVGKVAEPTRHRSGGDVAKKVVPPRRSRSVSAFSRTNLNVDSDFSNKRDNPLYWSTDADSPRLDGGGGVKVVKFDGAVSKLSGGSSKVFGVGGGSSGSSKISGAGGGSSGSSKVSGAGGGSSGSLKVSSVGAGSSGSVGGESRRGRSVSRYSDPVGGKSTYGSGGVGRGVGRSLSRVDTGRRRRSVSVSRRHYGNSESEREHESTSLRSRSKTGSSVRLVDDIKSTVDRSDSDLSELLNVWRTWSSEQDFSAVGQWEDGGSICSFSDAEERIGKPVSELLNIMRRSTSSSTLSTDIADIPLELVNPAEAELVFEVRGEYSRKLEESQERARKLRAELAVEEYREVELNKVLEEMIEHSKTPEVKKPRAIRKASMERRKASRRLEEEALAYFDECVSISTFDGSDFSSLEDPLSNIVGGAEQHGSRVNIPGGSASVSVNPRSIQSLDPSNQIVPKDSPCNSNSNNPCLESPSTSSSKNSWKRQFSFASKQKDSTGFTQELRSYAKIFAKGGGGKEISSSPTVNQNRVDIDEYVFSIPSEKFLFEKVANKYRLDSGGMLLCGGATGFPFSPFSSVL